MKYAVLALCLAVLIAGCTGQSSARDRDGQKELPVRELTTTTGPKISQQEAENIAAAFVKEIQDEIEKNATAKTEVITEPLGAKFIKINGGYYWMVETRVMVGIPGMTKRLPLFDLAATTFVNADTGKVPDNSKRSGKFAPDKSYTTDFSDWKSEGDSAAFTSSTEGGLTVSAIDYAHVKKDDFKGFSISAEGKRIKKIGYKFSTNYDNKKMVLMLVSENAFRIWGEYGVSENNEEYIEFVEPVEKVEFRLHEVTEGNSIIGWQFKISQVDIQYA